MRAAGVMREVGGYVIDIVLGRGEEGSKDHDA